MVVNFFRDFLVFEGEEECYLEIGMTIWLSPMGTRKFIQYE